MAVNFSKHQEAISDAWKAVVDEKNNTNWVLLGYENQTNYLKIMETGSRLLELVSEFNCSLIQYAFCRIQDEALGINKLVLIHWQGESAPLTRKGLCASHVNDVANYFKGCSQTITIRNEDEATPDYILQQVKRSTSTMINIREKRSEVAENMEPVGTNYKPLKVSQEIGSIDRKKFWQQEEEAEKRRIEEEKIRAEVKRAQFEKERKQKEVVEAKKMEQSLIEREKSIDATRQANVESEKKLKGNDQPNSISIIRRNDKDDARPGAQSDQMRWERNQETSALISKGTIKNKRAIFEQQVANNQPTVVNRLERRTSGAVVTERMKAFRSLETNVPRPMTVQQPIKKETSNNNSSKGATSAIQNGDTHEVKAANEMKSTSPVNEESKNLNDSAIVDEKLTPLLKLTNITESPRNVPETTLQPNGVNYNDEFNAAKTNCENETSISDEADISLESSNSPEKLNNSKSNSSSSIEVHKLSAKAVYDYQAADQTEISFDPDDIISHIERVDPGWWQGVVVTGRFKGQVGLFPSNYVELLPTTKKK